MAYSEINRIQKLYGDFHDGYPWDAQVRPPSKTRRDLNGVAETGSERGDCVWTREEDECVNSPLLHSTMAAAASRAPRTRHFTWTNTCHRTEVSTAELSRLGKSPQYLSPRPGSKDKYVSGLPRVTPVTSRKRKAVIGVRVSLKAPRGSCIALHSPSIALSTHGWECVTRGGNGFPEGAKSEQPHTTFHV